MAKKQQELTSTRAALTDAFNDVTKAPQAMTQEDVNAQDTRTRLWQSLDSTYGNQREQSDRQYDRAISQQDQAFMNRGMQRSSYAGQTLANMQQQKIQANNEIMANQIADYQNRLNTLETQEQQFAYQKERDRIADEQWQKQFDAQQNQFKQQFEYNKMTNQQQIAFNYLSNMLEADDNPSDSLLKQAGISRSDYEQMKAAVKQLKAKSGGGGGGNGNGNGNENTDNGKPGWYNLLFGNTNSTNSNGSVNTTPTSTIGNLLSVQGASTPKRRDWETSNKPKKQYIKAETTSNK